MGMVIQLGLTVVVSTLLGFYAGQWVDGRLDTGLVFTFIGLTLGIGAGVRSAYELVKKMLGPRGKGEDA